MRYKAHDYQRRAIEWVMTHPHCGLFMDMGLGKTVCTLTAIARLIDRMAIEKVLVIAPKKVAESTWSDECSAWDHLSDLRVSVVMGTPRQRLGALNTDADIYVSSRDMVTWLQSLKPGRDRPQFDMIVIDELTSFKSQGSQRFKAMKKLRLEAQRVVGLTGTPAPNGLLDLWAQIYCIDGGQRLGPYVTRYRDTYFHSVMHNHIPIKVWPKAGAEIAITDKISDICFTMQAEDYLSLPPINYHDVPVQMGAKVYEGYRHFEQQRVAEFKESEETVTAVNAASLVNKLSQYSNGAIYVDTGTKWTEIHDAKIEMLYELVEKAHSPVLCFYGFVHDRERIMARAPKKLKVRQYTGADDLKDWNDGKIDLLLAHPASTAYGLNMQRGGSVIIWFTTGWNLEHYQQANARLHRQGQQKPVQVYNLICEGTVDRRMVNALRGKDTQQDSVIKRLAMEVINVECRM